jgi:adenylate cyclase
MSQAVGALAVLGEVERAKEWAERAMLLDPDNLNLRYNIACSFVTDLREFEVAMDLLEPAFQKLRGEAMNWSRIDPDLDLIRDHPRFKAMLAAAEARLAKS